MPRNPDRTDLCHFTYADGRRCTLPESSNSFGLCYDHARKHQAVFDAHKALAVTRRVTRFLENPVRTPTELCAALAALFVVTAEGHVKPKTAARLTYRVQCLLQSPPSTNPGSREPVARDTQRNTVKPPYLPSNAPHSLDNALRLPDKTPQASRLLTQSTVQAPR